VCVCLCVCVCVYSFHEQTHFDPCPAQISLNYFLKILKKEPLNLCVRIQTLLFGLQQHKRTRARDPRLIWLKRIIMGALTR